MYSEYGDNELYYNLPNVKWIVDNCNEAMREDCINKKLKIIQISFGYSFNQSIKSLQHCADLKYTSLLKYYDQQLNMSHNIHIVRI